MWGSIKDGSGPAMVNNLKVSILFPCYNEEGGLKAILGSIPALVDEVIVIDNASSDNTAQVARSHKARVLVEDEKGYGRALLKGLKHATGELIVIMDADNSYPLEALGGISSYMEEKRLDFVSGYRFPLTDSKSMPFVNLVSNYFISFLIRCLFKIRLRDSQSGMMVFKKSILKEVEVNNCGMGFSQEIKIKAWLNPYINCGEYRIPYFPRTGKVKFNKIKDGTNNLYAVLALWIKKLAAHKQLIADGAL